MTAPMKRPAWIDELIRWEMTHPEWTPFKEDSDSQRELHRYEPDMDRCG